MKFNNLLKLLFLSLPVFATDDKRLAKIFNECTKPGVVALTMDDGPHTKFTPKVLDLLKANNIKATFFLNGMNYGSDVENDEVTKSIIKRQVAEGHDVGSHTFFHKDCFQAFEDGTLKENIERMQKAIENVVHRTPKFFRPPEGKGGFSQEYCEKMNIEYDPRTEIIRGVLAGDGYRYGPDYGDYDYDIILWSADPEDWKCDGTTLTVKDAIASLDLTMGPTVADPSKNSFIILVHDVTEYSVSTIIPEIISHVKKLGYTFVPLSECIGRKAYREVEEEEEDNSRSVEIAAPETNAPFEEADAELEDVVPPDTEVDGGAGNTIDDTVGQSIDEAVMAPNTEVDTVNEVDPNTTGNVSADIQDGDSTVKSKDKSLAQTNNEMIVDDQQDDNSSAGNLSILTFSSILLYCLMAYLSYY